jgi:branched-subunit amino acid aminotransferase/4-amino-4-deoxychorismate lyase
MKDPVRNPRLVSVNGQLGPADSAGISIYDPGFLLGLGLFETLLVEDGVAVFLEDHMRRLARGLRHLNFPELPWDPAEETHRVIEANGARSAITRITVTPGPEQGPPTLVVMLREFLKVEPPIRLAISPHPIDPASPMAGIKATSRVKYELSRGWARSQGCFEALVPTTQGDLAEGTISNLFITLEGDVRTPPLNRGILPGVVRRKILDVCKRAGIPVRERRIQREDLQKAGEVFVTNSSQGVLGVDGIRGLKRRLPGAAGSVTRRIGDLYRSEVDRYKKAKQAGV